MWSDNGGRLLAGRPIGRLGGVSGISIVPSRRESPRRYISIRRHIITFRMAMQWRRSDRDGRRDMSLRRIILDCEILEATVETAGWAPEDKIGRESCREGGCQYVEISGVGVSLKKNKS